MRAAIFADASGLSIENISIDKPGPDEVLIRTCAAGVCHSDELVVSRQYAHAMPVALGHESAGVVIEVGDRVTYVKPGDHVVTSPSVFCGECDYCLSGRSWLCRREGLTRPETAGPRLSMGGQTVHQYAGLASFAEQMLVHERAVVKIPDDVPFAVAALLGCGVTTGLGAVFRTASVEPGATVAVVGCGGIGLNSIQAAVLAGASRIIAIDVSESKLARAAEFGATDLIDSRRADIVELIKSMTNGGVDYSFESAGRKDTAQLCASILRRGGTATIIGLAPAGTIYEFPASELHDRTIQGCVMGSNRFRSDIPVYLEYYRQGRLKLDELVSARVPLDGLAGAFDAMVNSDVARTVIDFERAV